MKKIKQKIEVSKEVTIRFRCTSEESQKIRLLAEKKGITISEYIRSKVLR